VRGFACTPVADGKGREAVRAKVISVYQYRHHHCIQPAAIASHTDHAGVALDSTDSRRRDAQHIDLPKTPEHSVRSATCLPYGGDGVPRGIGRCDN